jgi:hypothetical protein
MGESEENALEEGIFQLEPRKKGYRPTLLIKRFATAPILKGSVPTYFPSLSCFLGLGRQ